jgi:hypothetical protein
MGRRIAIVASAPRFCGVCEGSGFLRVVALLDIPAVGWVAPCVHCAPRAGVKPIEVPVPPPFHIDTPRIA